jgi:molecular chaperone DnaK (HSP70)
MTLEQVVGMILKNIKQLASHQAGTDIRDVVISVPSNWGFHAKLCLVNAANLADFSVLGLINENSAAAINFAISRNDTEPLNIIIFNYGSHNLQVSMVTLCFYLDKSIRLF